MRFFGRRRNCANFGGFTVTVGNSVAAPALGAGAGEAVGAGVAAGAGAWAGVCAGVGAAAGACARAAPPRLASMSAAALQAAAMDLEGADIGPDFRSSYCPNRLGRGACRQHT